MKGVFMACCVWGKTELETPITVQRAEYKGPRLQTASKHSVQFILKVSSKNYNICKSSFQETEILNMSPNF